MNTNKEAGVERITILLHSGSYDKVTNALSLAIIGLTMGMEVYVLLTYEALRRFVKGHFEDREGTDDELFTRIHAGVVEERFHDIEEKLAAAKELGMKLYACTTAMATYGLTREDLVDEVDEIMGLVSFVQLARTAAINWYI